jgi:hypothetical protein
MGAEVDNIVSRYKAIHEKVLDNIANDYMARGEGTGAASKVLSQIWFLMLIFLFAQLFKDGKYVLMLVVVAFSWTRFGSFVMPIALIYLLVNKHWVAAASVGALVITMMLSWSLGWRNVKRLLRSGKPMISPFEGMPDMLLIMIVECLCFAVALLTNGWFNLVLWILFTIVLLYHSVRLVFRLRPRWRQVHNPLMIRYARAAGEESAQSGLEKREFDFHRATANLLKSVYPTREDDEIAEMVDLADDKLQAFSDRSLIDETIRTRNPTVSREHCAQALDEIGRYLQSGDGQKLIVRYAIADVVEHVFDQTERGRYLAAVFAGEAT